MMRAVVESLEGRLLLNAAAPDSTFGHAGLVETQSFTGPYTASASAVVVQPDGKIITAGRAALTGRSGYLALARYNPDGSADTSFGSGGSELTSVVVSQLGSKVELALQPDGKIVEAAQDALDPAEVVRFNPNGSLDMSFGESGVATLSPGTSEIGAMEVAPDGTLVVAAMIGSPFAGQQLTIARLNSDGSLDSAFGGGQVTAAARLGVPAALSLAFQASGKLLVGVADQNLSGIFRYGADGSLDSSFGAGGMIGPYIPVSPNVMMVQPDGKILLAGDAGSGSLGMTRLNPDGSLDTAFSSNGWIPVFSWEPTFLFQPDGKLLVAGVDGQNTIALRADADGTLDPSFGGNTGVPGIAEAQIGQVPGVTALAIGPGGTFFSAASSNKPGSPFVTARWSAAGQPDQSFGGTQGYAATAFVGPLGSAVSHVIGVPDGTIITGAGDLLTRYEPNGSLDKTFGNAGVVLLHASEETDVVTGLAVLPDGQIVLGGYTSAQNATSEFFVARLNANGSLDSTFGSGGVSTIAISGELDAYLSSAFSIDGSGDLIVAADYRSSPGAPGQIVMVRFRPDGALDSSFGTDGAEFSASTSSESMGAMTSDAQDRIVMAIDAFGSGQSQFDLLRYNADGTLDPSFGVGGIVVTDLPNGYGSFGLRAVTIDTSGNILACGGNYDGGARVLRYLPNGAPDPTFGVNGAASISVGLGNLLHAIAVQSNGKIVLAGSASGDIPYLPFLARLDSSGAMDPTFGAGGVAATNVPGRSDLQWWDMRLDSAGRILLGGVLPDDNQNAVPVGVIGRYLSTDPATISGTVFSDANNNGLFDSSESGLAGVTTYLDTNNNGRLDASELSVTTDSSGRYTFSDLPAGTYIVREVVPAGYAETAPLGYEQAVGVASGQTASGPIFGDVLISSVTMDAAYISTIARNFGTTGTFATGDLNGDGTVNLADLLLAIENIGHALPNAPAGGQTHSLPGRLAARRVR